MKFLKRHTEIINAGSPTLSLGWPTGIQGVSYFCLRTSVVGNPRIFRQSSFQRPTYKVGRVIFVDGEGFSVEDKWIETEKMNFGFWAVAGGEPTERIHHYQDSIERRGSGNYQCFIGENAPGGIQIPIPGIPGSSTQYTKEPLTPLDDLLPEDFDQALCRVRVKQVVQVSSRTETGTDVLCGILPYSNPVPCVIWPETSYTDLPYYTDEMSATSYQGHEDNGFTQYYDPRRHHGGKWARGFHIEKMPDSGNIQIEVLVDLYQGV